ncbi:MAG TPA: M20/M25/M40 family metallo-hydrolase, partial [Pseudomonadales bacterium]|nr:M20/M25/M40 family metallo-hydrolase [Pseudomonadales bacterium]
ATMMHRMQQRGDRIVLELKMQAQQYEDVVSHNLIGELTGSELPEEIVVVSGHIDAWDVGQGAQDDGVGCMISLGATALLRQLDLTPRRTIRVVFWTNEENGLQGARHYVRDHADELKLHVAAIESDSGNGRADGFRVDVNKQGFAHLGDGAEAAQQAAAESTMEKLEPIRLALEGLEAGTLTPSGSGADVGALAREGVLCFGLNHDWARYFDVHHTRADTFEKIVKADLDHNVAAMALMAFALADAPDRLLEWTQPASK